MSRYQINPQPNSIAILGHFDGLVGQLEGWFEQSTSYHIACYVYEAEVFEVDVAKENAQRSCKTTDFPNNNQLKGKPFVVSNDWIGELKHFGINKVLPMNPDNLQRFNQIKALRENNFELISAIHPSATIYNKAKIGEGVWIHEGVYVGYKSEVCDGVMLNTRAQVDHHSVLLDCCQLDPSVVTASYVTCGERSHIHMCSSIRNRVTVGNDAIVGMGSLVLKNVPPKTLVYGQPAKIIRSLS